ncbi:MAG: NADH-dependent alcohol dehydrogenase [Deltaproteobacteria bacterium CG_4_10_14_3_um_filter_60_8]|nr:MAG: NADH-dependent alcohol dehydrogenase [Desulfobacterales bacterium CG2_30_60_27]PIP43256.1 MAG: NADH-dependent alcohol dehydrogenase [Deltaproteobacteria bacterium CG23_combo_of_CG06-09_8_20_14_all_60_8]PIY21303.1 MAG: NADH-dependent alcohol dehydrogenase [Deltaproteobacteria bacterium CG_4_10_14_3_um_filter_60_8]
MFDFTFHNPTRIIFGKDTETRIGQELKQAGLGRVLLVYGRESIKRSGLYDRVTQSLKTNNIAWVEHAGVSSNPLLSHVRAGVELAKKAGVDGLLAVGGGSVLDEAKAIAVGALAADDIWHYFIGTEVTAALPVCTVLTIAATGSEMNGNAVVTNEATQQKYAIHSEHVYPRFSILDPALTCSVPPDYSAYAAVDVIAHVIEGYFTGQGDNLQNRLVEAIIKTVMATTDVIMAEPDDYNARAEFMWAATLALNGLTPAGIGEYSFPNHMIEHSLSAIYNIPHGAGLAMVMPAWMRWFAPCNPEKFERFARQIFGLRTAAEGIEALERWFVAIKAPIRLAEMDIPASDIDRIAANAAALAEAWSISETYTKEAIANILRLAV